MALTFIPSVWAARLLTALEATLVYGQAHVANRDYEGEIREAGSSVRIASVGDVNIGSYTKNTDINDPEVLDDSTQTLNIDQAKYFNFFVDSVDRAQQNVNILDEAMDGRHGLFAMSRQVLASTMLDGILANVIEQKNRRSAPDPMNIWLTSASCLMRRTPHRKEDMSSCRRGFTECC